MESQNLHIKGARQHNIKNIDVEMPRGRRDRPAASGRAAHSASGRLPAERSPDRFVDAHVVPAPTFADKVHVSRSNPSEFREMPALHQRMLKIPGHLNEEIELALLCDAPVGSG